MQSICHVADTDNRLSPKTAPSSKPNLKNPFSAKHETGGKKLLLLHRVSSHSTPVDQAHLRQISELVQRFPVVAALSDHTCGTSVSVAGIAVGAVAAEKRLTVSREDNSPGCETLRGPDGPERSCNKTREARFRIRAGGTSQQNAAGRSTAFRRPTVLSKCLPVGMPVGRQDAVVCAPACGSPLIVPIA
ncbi:N-acetylneuraminate synthase family protein [Castellaniella sp. UC4447_H14]